MDIDWSKYSKYILMDLSSMAPYRRSPVILLDEMNDMTFCKICQHEWINVGFHFDKYVCKKCDKDKE